MIRRSFVEHRVIRLAGFTYCVFCCELAVAQSQLIVDNPNPFIVHYSMNGQNQALGPNSRNVHSNATGEFRVGFDWSFADGFQPRQYMLRPNSRNRFGRLPTGLDLYFDGPMAPNGPVVAAKPAVPSFPIRSESAWQTVASRGTMKTSLSIDQNGVLLATTKLRVTGGLKGYTGGTSVIFLGDNDTYLGAHVAGPWGIDPNIAFWASHDGRRDETWSVRLPPQIVQQLRRVAIVHSREPKGMINTIKHALDQGNKAIDAVNSHGGQVLALVGAGVAN
jgi:hypothetical protein